MTKLLTVSIAAYNMEKYIRQALDSLLSCRHAQSIEIFVIDDGGTDHTLEIAKEYAWKHPGTVIPVHKENGGYGSTINYSIEHATGKYFKQLDGDDWFCADKLDDFICLLGNVDDDMVFSQTIEYHEDSGEETVRDVCGNMKTGSHLFEDSSFEGIVSMHSASIKTELLQRMDRKITEHCFYTDVELVCYPLVSANTFYVYHEPVYTYRLGREGQSMSIEGIRKHYKEHEKVFWELVDIYKTIPESETAKKILMKMRLRKETAAHFKYCCLLESLEAGQTELVSFAKLVKRNAPDILASAKDYSKFVFLMVMSNYMAYPILAHIQLRKALGNRIGWGGGGRELVEARAGYSGA